MKICEALKWVSDIEMQKSDQAISFLKKWRFSIKWAIFAVYIGQQLIFQDDCCRIIVLNLNKKLALKIADLCEHRTINVLLVYRQLHHVGYSTIRQRAGNFSRLIWNNEIFGGLDHRGWCSLSMKRRHIFMWHSGNTRPHNIVKMSYVLKLEWGDGYLHRFSKSWNINVLTSSRSTYIQKSIFFYRVSHLEWHLFCLVIVPYSVTLAL